MAARHLTCHDGPVPVPTPRREPSSPGPETPAAVGPRWLPALLVVVAVFVASRLAAYLLGVRFDVSSLPWYFQFLDQNLLRTDLVRSLWNQHCQPPLFNLYLGVVLKLAGPAYPTVFAATYLAMGLALQLGLCTLLLRLGLPPRWSVIATALFCVSPTSVLFESWLFYEYPVAAMLTLAALALHAWAASGRRRWGLAFLVLVTAVALTRTLFHLVWVVFAVGLALAAAPDRRRRLWGALAIPLVLVVGLHVKNWALFRLPGTSSWIGMNLARMTVFRLPPADRDALVHAGRLSAVSRVPPFSPVSSYPAELARTPTHAVPAVATPQRPGGIPNYNHWAYLAISKAYLGDALATIRARPGLYLDSVVRAWAMLWVPPSEHWFLDANRACLAGFDRLWDRVVGGVVHPVSQDRQALEARSYSRWVFLDPSYPWRHAGYGFMVVSLLALVVTMVALWPRDRRLPVDRATWVTLLFCVCSILNVVVVGSLLEIGENNRFRMSVEPLIVIVVTFAARWVATRRWSSRHRSREGDVRVSVLPDAAREPAQDTGG